MKPLFLILSLISITTLNAQMCPCEFGGKSTDKPLRNEIGLNLFNYNEILINFTANKTSYLQSYANGLMFKHHFNKFSLRAGFDYFENTFRYEASASDPLNYNLNNGKSFGKDFRLGLEKTLFLKKLQAYVAIDLLASSGKFSGISEGFGDTIAPYNIAYGFKVTSWGFSPAIGLKYRPFRHFSITAETSLSSIYYKTSKSIGYPSESNTAVLFNPLRALTFNYHF